MVFLALVMTAVASVVPLSDVRFDVSVSGPLADIEITQTFHNPTDETLEATYLFPLHERAVVDAMVMRLDDRTIEGRIEEREAARALYQAAIEKGQTAALTESVRWNLFRQTLGNIPPGARIEVSLRIIQPVPRIDGDFELVLPLVAGARFVAPGMTDAEALKAPYGDSPVRAHVHTLVDGGVSMRDFRVESHDAFVAPTGEGWEVHATDLPMTRDFVARWSTRTDEPQVGALHDGEHLLLVFEPPVQSDYSARRPREVVLVVDRSGSMQAAWQYAQQAAQTIVQGLRADDWVDVWYFAGSRRHMGSRPADEVGRRMAVAHLASGQPSGTTDLRGAVAAALAEPGDPARQRYVVVLSDGLVANESEILSDLAAYEGTAKIYALGIGGAVNRFVLEELAWQGGGVAAHLRGPDGMQPALQLVAALDRPVMSEVELDWGDWGAMHVSPGRVPDVHLGHPVQVLARTRYEEGGPITVSGRIAGEAVTLTVQPRRVARGRALASTWARQRIEALGRRQIREGIDAREEGLPLALEYSILSPWTAFIAIDPRTRQIRTRTVDVPLGQPGDRPALMPVTGKATVQMGHGTVREPVMTPDVSMPPPAEYRVEMESTVASRDYTTNTIQYDSGSAEMLNIGENRDLEDGFLRFTGQGGSTGPLRAGSAALATQLPLSPGYAAIGLQGALGTRAVEGGSWRHAPIGLWSANRVAYDTQLEVQLQGRYTDLTTPVFDADGATRRGLGATAGIAGRSATVSARLHQDRYSCGGCDAVDRTVGSAEASALFGRWERFAMAGLHFQRTGFAGLDTRSTTDLGVHARARYSERVWVLAEGRADALWVDGAFQPRPAGRIEIGGAGYAFHVAFGAAHEIGLETPELAIPTTTSAYLTAVAGRQAPRLTLTIGWERAGGPLALPIGRLQTLPDGRWSRDAIVSELAARTPDDERGQLGLVLRHTALVRSGVDLEAPDTPWVPGLLLAHRPFFGEADTRVLLLDRHWRTELVAAGGLASPVGGDAWWSGWQALGRLGLNERLPVRDSFLTLGLEGRLRSGRPGDVDLTRPDGWIAPDQLGTFGLFGSVTVDL